MGAVPAIFRGHAYMPIKLKSLLVQHGISHPVLAAEIKQAKDVPLSRTALNQILNHSYFPRNTTPDDIKTQIESVLLARGIPAAAMAAMWDDDTADIRGAHPMGAHVGRAANQKAARPVTNQPDFEMMEIQMLSPQAKRHFKLRRDPFLDDINGPDDVFMSESQHYVVEAMIQTALVGGITAAIGESGSGKSTLRKALQHRITNEGKKIRLIFPQTFDKSKLNTLSIATAIINDIESDSKIKQKNEAVARQVKDVLLHSSAGGYKHVLIIEEAHDLSITTLKYLKRFNEIDDISGFGKALSIVLIAQPEMKVKLDANRYPEAREFINRCEVATLDALNRGALREYITHKFARVGMAIDSVFSDDVFDAIYARWTKSDPNTHKVESNLYPLIVNNTVTRALNRAAELGLPLVTADLIKEL